MAILCPWSVETRENEAITEDTLSADCNHKFTGPFNPSLIIAIDMHTLIAIILVYLALDKEIKLGWISFASLKGTLLRSSFLFFS